MVYKTIKTFEIPLQKKMQIILLTDGMVEEYFKQNTAQWDPDLVFFYF